MCFYSMIILYKCLHKREYINFHSCLVLIKGIFFASPVILPIYIYIQWMRIIIIESAKVTGNTTNWKLDCIYGLDRDPFQPPSGPFILFKKIDMTERLEKKACGINKINEPLINGNEQQQQQQQKLPEENKIL